MSETKTYKGVKLRLYPTKEQESLLAQNAGCARWVYNHFLAKKIEHYQRTGETLSAYTLQADLPTLKKELEWLRAADSTSLQQAVNNLDLAFKNFFRRVKLGGPPGFPKFKRKGDRDSFRCVMSLAFEAGYLKVGKLGRIKTKGENGRLLDKKIKQITVMLEAGKWYASCLIETTTTVPHIHKYPSCGIDVGVAKPVTVAYGEKFKVLGIKFKQRLAKKEKKRKKYQRQLARKVKGSANRQKAKRRLSVAYQQERNLRLDWLHKATTNIAKRVETVVVEDLSLSNMTKAVKRTADGSPRKNVKAKSGLNRELLRLGLSTFYQFLEYKTKLYGGTLLRVDPKFTSQDCSACGHRSKLNRKSQAVFKCVSCGFKLNADYNAARNILNRG